MGPRPRAHQQQQQGSESARSSSSSSSFPIVIPNGVFLLGLAILQIGLFLYQQSQAHAWHAAQQGILESSNAAVPEEPRALAANCEPQLKQPQQAADDEQQRDLAPASAAASTSTDTTTTTSTTTTTTTTTTSSRAIPNAQDTQSLPTCPLDTQVYPPPPLDDNDATNNATSTNRRLFLVFGQERTGSTLLMDLVDQLQEATDDRSFNVIQVGELFNRLRSDSYRTLQQALKEMHKICSVERTAASVTSNNTNTTDKQDWFDELQMAQNASNSSLWRPLNRFLMQSAAGASHNNNWGKHLVNALNLRHQDPQRLLRFLKRTPSPTRAGQSANGHVAMKIFSNQIDRLGIEVDEFLGRILQVWHPQDIQVVVLWRRQPIGSYVSQEIARKRGTGAWFNATSGKNDALELGVRNFRKYLQFWFQYYRNVRTALERQQMPYSVLEYRRDLQQAADQTRVRRQLVDWMRVPMDQVDPAYLARTPTLKKQAQVETHELVTNWAELEQLGWTRDGHDWDRMFAADDFAWIRGE